MKPFSLWLAALCASACCVTHAGFWESKPRTVESISDSNGLSKNGYLRVRSSSILRVEPEDPVPADLRAAITEYDRMLSLPQDSIPASLRAEALRRAADLRLQLADSDAAGGGAFHVKDVRRAINGYRRLLADYPDYRFNDLALYQLARAHQLLTEVDPAIDALMRLSREYPHSERAADANFRAAELLFSERRFAEASAPYEALLKHGQEQPYFDMAQYKFAWSLYKQSQFERAAQAFIDILEQELPAGSVQNLEKALLTVPKTRQERVSESLRITSLSFAALGGGPALSEFFQRQDQPSRMEPLLYQNLGETLLERERYTEAAGAYQAFVQRHPTHISAPTFSQSAIQAYRQGGFDSLAFDETAAYATRYSPVAEYWLSREPQPEVLATVRGYQDSLGKYHQAAAQDLQDPVARQASFLKAAQWYERTLAEFPEDPDIAETSLLLADAKLEGGDAQGAALQYQHTAYELPPHDHSMDAALAAVQTWQGLAKAAENNGDRERALASSVASSHRLAETFQQHPQRLKVLMAASEDEYALGDLEAASRTAALVLSASPTPQIQQTALTLIGDANFEQERFVEAESAYSQALELNVGSGARQAHVVERLARSIYRLGELARDSGDLRQAADHFQRVARLAPTSSVRQAADYDAASCLFELEQWPEAVLALERFRQRHPQHALIPDTDKKLAFAYQQDQQDTAAAAVFERIAARNSESLETRRTAAWTAAELYQKARLDGQSLKAWTAYAEQYPRPLDAAMQALQEASKLSHALHGDTQTHRRWLERIVATDRTAGSERSAYSRQLAAESSLELGRLAAANTRRIALSAPLDRSLPTRKAETETALQHLNYAAELGFERITSAATFETARLYADFGRALLDSERPDDLGAEALQQYALLLEEQAYPFEEKAIQAHEINLARVKNGSWNVEIGKSVSELGALSPALYAKQEQREPIYERLD